MFLTVADAAERLKVSEAKVRAMIASGQLPARNISTGRRPTWRILESDLEKVGMRSAPRARRTQIATVADEVLFFPLGGQT
jgi:excisionase family DNA binding protein